MVDDAGNVVGTTEVHAAGPRPRLEVRSIEVEVEVGPMVEDPDRYADLLLRAYDPDHPDYDDDLVDLPATTAIMAAFFDGSVMGPFIDPGHRRRGVAWALIRFAVGALRAEGRHHLGLSVHVDNPAKRLYERIGFVRTSDWTTFIL